MANLNWSQIQIEINKALTFFESQGVRPTLRTIFYNLVSQNIIGNTKATYQGLSKQLVRARKAHLVPWDALEDSARNVYGNFNDDVFRDDLVDWNKENLGVKLGDFNAENILNDFFDYAVSRAYVGRWANQPQTCEIWIEKEALAKTVEEWTKGLGVKIRVNKGYSSWTFLYNNCRDLANVLKRHEGVTVFYLGDMDPSGVDMERFLNEALVYFRLDGRVNLERLSVTDEQVRRYKLPPKPEDAETLAKLKRDARSASYTGQYIVELDAMVAFVPQEFKRIILDAINRVWDREIYEDLKEMAKSINELIDEELTATKERAKELLKNL
jgi:hypothetical protein